MALHALRAAGMARVQPWGPPSQLRVARPLLAQRRRAARRGRLALPAAAAATVLMPVTATGGGALAAAALAQALHAVQGADLHVLSATVGAAGKLAMVCGLVGWLLRTGQLPPNTAAVMSKVSFSLLYPSMLFTRVAATVASQPSPSIMLAISLATVGQVAVAALLAGLVGPAVDRLLGQQQHALAAGSSGGSGSGSSESGDLHRLVTLACSFGSSFTLPAVFFASMLPGPLADRALGYTALILLSWSPLMWSFGHRVVTDGEGSGGAAAGSSGGQPTSSSGGIGSPIREPPSPRRLAVASAGTRVPAVAAAAAVGLAPPIPAAEVAEALSEHLQAAWRVAAAMGRQVLTPPFLAILAGMAAGMTPLGRALVGAGAAPSGLVARTGFGLAQAALDVIRMLAQGTLAAQTVVLAASLLQPSSSSSNGSSPQATGFRSPAPPGSPSRQFGSSGGCGSGMFGGLRRMLLPESTSEARALATVAVVRFLLLPALTLGMLCSLTRAGLLPPAVAADPILLLVLLVGSVMPPAQNLIVLCSLSPSTASLGPLMASLLLKTYALSVIPVSLWVTCWATWLGVAVA